MDFLTLEAGINRLSWNVGKELPLYAALYLRRAQIARLGNVGLGLAPHVPVQFHASCTN